MLINYWIMITVLRQRRMQVRIFIIQRSVFMGKMLGKNVMVASHHIDKIMLKMIVITTSDRLFLC